MVVGAKVCELTNGFLWFVCGLYVEILTSPLTCGNLQAEPLPLCMRVEPSEVRHLCLEIVVCRPESQSPPQSPRPPKISQNGVRPPKAIPAVQGWPQIRTALLKGPGGGII